MSIWRVCLKIPMYFCKDKSKRVIKENLQEAPFFSQLRYLGSVLSAHSSFSRMCHRQSYNKQKRKGLNESVLAIEFKMLWSCMVEPVEPVKRQALSLALPLFVSVWERVCLRWGIKMLHWLTRDSGIITYWLPGCLSYNVWTFAQAELSCLFCEYVWAGIYASVCTCVHKQQKDCGLVLSFIHI